MARFIKLTRIGEPPRQVSFNVAHIVSIEERSTSGTEIGTVFNYQTVTESFDQIMSEIEGFSEREKAIFKNSRALAEQLPPGANFGQVKAEPDRVVLSIRESTQHEREFEATDYERFVFEIDGKPYLWGTLNECMEARHAYALECDQRGVPYTMTDLPEPYKSDLADFAENPIVGVKP